MKIQNPQIGLLEETNNIQEELEMATKSQDDVISKKFVDAIETLNAEKVEISKCHFKNCKCIQSSLQKVYFSDVIFEECDFSNTNFNHSNFVRVKFVNCKLVGCNFSECDFYHILIENTNARYTNFSVSTWKNVQIDSSNMESSSLQDLSLEKVELDNVNLTLAQLFHTSLQKIDFRTCQIEGIVVDEKDLRGAIVNEYQAIELSKLLGLVIK